MYGDVTDVAKSRHSRLAVLALALALASTVASTVHSHPADEANVRNAGCSACVLTLVPVESTACSAAVVRPATEPSTVPDLLRVQCVGRVRGPSSPRAPPSRLPSETA
jgi:hypothetical protein